MKTKCSFAVGLFFASLLVCRGVEMVQQIDWAKLAEAKGLASGRLVQADGRSALELTNTNRAAATFCVLSLPHPGVTERVYAIEGMVSYQEVSGDGYLEMWSRFPAPSAGLAEAAFFSRTLGVSGPMQKLSGSSGWRRFILPFDRTGTSNAPVSLQMNVVLPGEGKVMLSDLKLVQSRGSVASLMASSTGAWWSDTTGGIIGGCAGAVLGSFAGLLGWLAMRGRARGFVLASLLVLSGIGIASLLAGMAAIFAHQPYGVWFVLVLLGILLGGICSFRLVQFRKHYELLEVRRIAALDAQG